MSIERTSKDSAPQGIHPRQTLGKAVLGGEDKKLPPLLNQKEKQWMGGNGLGCVMCTSCCVLTQW